MGLFFSSQKSAEKACAHQALALQRCLTLNDFQIERCKPLYESYERCAKKYKS
jgi:hypothetical protein